ncbi:MAG TPA: TMEM165/GDT1 family protein [Rhizomicrobium sp.]|nr:TMEM165/GDT1 family protein [Rhizomicrobium sp.]
MSQLVVMFLTIFVAELGDKTQLATMLYAAEGKSSPAAVFAASAGALVLGAGISVALGTLGGRYLDAIPLKLIAGIGFVVIGIWTIAQYYRGA